MSKSQEKIRSLTKKLPGTPGVYKFIGSKKEVLYVGKATSLKRTTLFFLSRN
jgi:excinuclease UvrABC nuclease subunit